MHALDVKDYLSRIGLEGKGNLSPTKENLHLINSHHLLHVPFENLDLTMGIEVVASVDKCWEKIVKKHRGGWCHEHILVIEKALSILGYKTKRGTGQVFVGPGALSPPGSHAFAHVTFDDGSKFLVDVGFPDTTTSALEITDNMLDKTQITSNARQFKVTKEGPIYFRWNYEPATKTWNKSWQWDESTPSIQVELYDQGNKWVQCGPNSPFQKNAIISLALPSGRITLSGLNKIVTDASGNKTRTTISKEEFLETLRKSFGFDLPNFFKNQEDCNEFPLVALLQ